jgi:hypothetical protein
MPTLTVSEFSCLKHAVFEPAPVTVIIGPQGSGKSVTTKLFYFFADILSSFPQAAERDDNIEEFKRWVSRQFCIWFPPVAWGKGRFNISFSAGLFTVRLLRRISNGKNTDDVSVTFSDWFTDNYKQAQSLYSKYQRADDLNLASHTRILERT